jgi:hypothetical protein
MEKHFTSQDLYECRSCGSRLIQDGKCLTCDSVQIDIIKEKDVQPC